MKKFMQTFYAAKLSNPTGNVNQSTLSLKNQMKMINA